MAKGITYQVEIDEQTGSPKEKVISDRRNKKLIPTLLNQGTIRMKVSGSYKPRLDRYHGRRMETKYNEGEDFG